MGRRKLEWVAGTWRRAHDWGMGRTVKKKAKRRGKRKAPGSESRGTQKSRGTQEMSAGQMNALRDLFWCNVIRDMLNGLSMLCQKQPELFDGRFGLLMRRGERIPIAQVHPLFACSIPGTQGERDASAAVQCTVFQVQTPEGEVFTVPVHEIRGMHTMTAELIEQLQKMAEREAEGEGEGEGEEDAEQRPFGLAAFAALPKREMGARDIEGMGE